MTKLLIGTLSLALVGVGGLVAAVDGFGEDRPVRSVSIPAGTTDDVGDVPETTTSTTTNGATNTNGSTDERADEDNSGPGSSSSGQGRGRGRGRGGDD